jgi:L-alanine-DL-glutamate epimerase-like enolase superfamily enzyme
MKITDVEAIHLRAGLGSDELFDGSYDNCVIVVQTDERLVGVGETESLSAAVQAIINGPSSHSRACGLRDVLVGRDPTDTEGLWNRMYAATEYVGRRGLVMHALGGIDLALWDIRGKAYGKPVHELLGVQCHTRVPAYATLYPMKRTTGEVRRQVEEAQSRHLRAFKFSADPWWMDDLNHTGELLRAAREAAGTDARLIVDAALAFRTAEEGLRLLPILQEVGVWFLEAPLPLDDVEGHARMAGQGVPLGVGDLGLTHTREFIEMMERGQADICQPDITMVGGFTGIRKIAEEARRRGRRVIPHGYKTNIEIAANLHFLACTTEEPILEYSLSPSPLRWDTTLESFPVEEDGAVIVPDRPGLGVTLNMETVKRYAWPPIHRPSSHDQPGPSSRCS